MQEHPIIFFDGVCNLCNGAVQWVLARDPHGIFHFASLQSDFGKKWQLEHGINPEKLDSILLFSEGKVYEKSSAVLKILQKLGGWWAIGYVFMVVPTFLRDGMYHVVARNRYRWFGKKEECWLPQAKWKARFLT